MGQRLTKAHHYFLVPGSYHGLTGDMNLIVFTQDHEWYGNEAHTEGRWKPKGGSEYQVAVLTPDEAINADLVKRLVDVAYGLVNYWGADFRTEAVGHQILADGDLTPSERAQMDWGREITYPRSDLSLPLWRRTVSNILDNHVSGDRLIKGHEALNAALVRAFAGHEPDILVNYRRSVALLAQIHPSLFSEESK